MKTMKTMKTRGGSGPGPAGAGPGAESPEALDCLPDERRR